MKGHIFNPEQFEQVVYGGQTLFIKPYPTTCGPIVLCDRQGIATPFTADSGGNPQKQVNPHFKLNERYFIKEEWKVISVRKCEAKPWLSGTRAVMYADDINPAMTGGELQNGINTFLFKNTLLPDNSIPGLEMSASSLFPPSTMPFWASRYGFKISSVSFANLHDLPLARITQFIGSQQVTDDNFRQTWDLLANPSRRWSKNPVVGLYGFEIINLNAYNLHQDLKA